jgi:hypothetical protein
VLAAPAAVLAELDPTRIVPLRLLGLVVPPLAILASEGHGDSNVAGHRSSNLVGAAPGEEKPRREREVEAV